MKTPIRARLDENIENGTILRVLVPIPNFLDDKEHLSTDGIYYRGELRLDDGRTITAEQRKKAYATMADIADALGYPPEYLKMLMKYWYMAYTDSEEFSLSNCSVTTARLFINFLIEFAFEQGIPLRDSILNRTDDISSALYASLMYKRCVICNAEGELHEENAAMVQRGRGRPKKVIIRLGMKVLCLCPKHRTEAYAIGKTNFNNRYHIYGLEADARICGVWKPKGR